MRIIYKLGFAFGIVMILTAISVALAIFFTALPEFMKWFATKIDGTSLFSQITPMLVVLVVLDGAMVSLWYWLMAGKKVLLRRKHNAESSL